MEVLAEAPKPLFPLRGALHWGLFANVGGFQVAILRCCPQVCFCVWGQCGCHNRSFFIFIFYKSVVEIFADGSPVGTEREKVRFTGIRECIVLRERVPDVQNTGESSKKLGVA